MHVLPCLKKLIEKVPLSPLQHKASVLDKMFRTTGPSSVTSVSDGSN